MMRAGPRPTAAMPRRVAIGSLALLLLAAVAFWPQYLSRPGASIDAYTHVHAFLGLLWMLVLIVQPWLVATRRMPVHRALGRFTYVLAPAFVVTGILVAHVRFSRMPDEIFVREAFSLYLPLFVATLFGLAYSMGLRWRRSPLVHARFMASTAVLFIDPVLGRILFFNFPPLPQPLLYQAITFSLVTAILVAMLRTLPDGTAGRAAYRAYVALAVAAQLLWFVLPPTAAWLAFASWFRVLPLT